MSRSGARWAALLSWWLACLPALAQAPASSLGVPPGSTSPASNTVTQEAVILTELNTANQAELEMVRGVGPDLSTRILATRQERPFRDWADAIARLQGIGKVRAARLSSEGLRVNGQAYPLNANTRANPSAPAEHSAPQPAR